MNMKSKKFLTGLMTIAIVGTISGSIPTKSNAGINLAPRMYQKSSSSTNIVLEFKDNSGLKSVKVNDKEIISDLKNQKKSGNKIISGTYEIKKTTETSKLGVNYKIEVEDLSGKKFTDPITTYYSTNLKKLYMNRAPRISITGESTNKGYYKTATLEINDNSKFKSVKLFKKIDGSYKEITDFSKVTTTMKDKKGEKVTKLEDAVELSFSLKSIGVGTYKIEAIDKTEKKQTRTFNVIEETSSSTDTTKKEETENKENTTNKEETENKENTTNKEETENKENTTNKENTDSKEYRYIQNNDRGPRYSLDLSNKDYVLIKFIDNIGVDTNSIKLYKYDSTTKKYDKEIKIEVLKENEVLNKEKRTTVKVLRKDISTKNEAVKIKIVAKDKDKNVNGVNAYIVLKPLAEEKNKKWYSIDNAPRIYITNRVECKKEEDVLKKKVNVKLVDTQGIKTLEIYDLNSSTPTKAKETVTGKTSYKLDLSKYTVKKAPSGKNACKIRFVIVDKNGRRRNEVMYFTSRKYERIPATTLNLSSEKLTINKGKTKTLKATIKPNNTTDTVKYTSSDKNIATVDATGKITAKSGGTATITVQVGDLKKECKVTVKEVKVEKITLDKTDITLNQTNHEMITKKTVKGQPTATLKATITPSNATDKTIKYTSSNKKVATVDSNGKITAHLQGTATITATASNGKKATCKVVVKQKTVPGYTAYTASISPKKVEVKKGEVFNLEVFYTRPNEVGYHWSFYVKEVAEYDVKNSSELFIDVNDPKANSHSMHHNQKNTLTLKATKKGTFHLIFAVIRKDNRDIIVLSNEVEIVVK